MSSIFQRPLCEMGRAFDFAFRPLVGDPRPGDGGPCDDRPTRWELVGADADLSSSGPTARPFLLCPEHAHQLQRYDAEIVARGLPSRFHPASRR